MIKSFADKDTAALANGERVRRWINIESVARRMLTQLHAAATLNFMRVPPGNRLDA
jgi:proteic killer suppression protein